MILVGLFAINSDLDNDGLFLSSLSTSLPSYGNRKSDSKGEHSLSKKCYIPNEQKVGTSRFSRVSKYAKRDGCHGWHHYRDFRMLQVRAWAKFIPKTPMYNCYIKFRFISAHLKMGERTASVNDLSSYSILVSISSHSVIYGGRYAILMYII